MMRNLIARCASFERVQSVSLFPEDVLLCSVLVPRGCSLFTMWCTIICWPYLVVTTPKFYGAGLSGQYTLVVEKGV